MTLGTIVMVAAIVVFVVLPTFKDRVFSVGKLIITPVIFMYLLYRSITKSFLLHTTSYYVILLGIVTGILIGTLIARRMRLKVDRDNQLMWLPGNYLRLMIFLFIFSVHFAIGFFESTHPAFLRHVNPDQLILLFVLVASSTSTLGMNLTLYYRYRTAESNQLTLGKQS